MHGAGIGPDQQIADLPFMAIDILRLRGPVAKLREQRAAFLGGPSDDVIGGGAQQQRLAPGLVRPDQRSEEHTSELQSLMRISYAVFCLKKKNTTNKTHHYK